MIKRDYTPSEWLKKEEEYMGILEGLVIPPNPTVKEIMELTSKLDSAYTTAGFECAMIKRKYERVSLDMKNAEAEMFNIIKKFEIVSGNKVTENDIKGMVKTRLKNEKLPGYNVDIYTTIKAVMDRLVFIEQVVKTISEKKGSIISTTAMLKLEHGFSGAKDL